MNQRLESRNKVNTEVLDRINTGIGNGANIPKRSDYENKVVVWFNDKADLLKKPIFLDKVVIETLNKADIRADNKVDMKKETNWGNIIVVRFDELITKNGVVIKVLNRINTRDSNRADMTKRPDFKDEVIARIWTKKNTKVSYKLDMFISVDNYFLAFDSTSVSNFFNFIFFGSLATCNPDNILAFYY